MNLNHCETDVTVVTGNKCHQVATTSTEANTVTLQLAARESVEHLKGMDEVYRIMRNRPLIIKAYAVDDPNAPAQEGNHIKTLHFVRHGQGYHNLIADLYEEQGKKWIPVSRKSSISHHKCLFTMWFPASNILL